VGNKVYALTCTLIGVILFLFWAYPLRVRALAGENDFMQLYAGAKLIGSPDLYEVEASKRVQVEATGKSYRGVYYSRPPFYAALVKPLAWLPFHAAYIVFQCLSLLALALALWFLVPDCRDLAFLACTSLPALMNFTMGQDLSFVLCFATLSIVLLRRNRPFLAGLVLALCAIKFHIFILVPLAILLHRKWRMLQGWLTGAGILTAISFIAAGWNWPSAYLNAIGNPEMNAFPEQMTTLRSVLFDAHLDSPWAMALSGLLIALLFAYAAANVADFETAFALAIIGGLLICYHAYMQDCMLMLLVYPLLVRGKASKALRIGMFIAMIPPAYLLLFSPPPFNVTVPVLFTLLLVIAAKDAYERANSAAPRYQTT
jgi:hypothetical protein